MAPERRKAIETLLAASTGQGYGWVEDGRTWDIECPSTDPEVSTDNELIAMHIPEPADRTLLLHAPSIIRELLAEIDRLTSSCHVCDEAH